MDIISPIIECISVVWLTAQLYDRYPLYQLYNPSAHQLYDMTVQISKLICTSYTTYCFLINTIYISCNVNELIFPIDFSVIIFKNSIFMLVDFSTQLSLSACLCVCFDSSHSLLSSVLKIWAFVLHKNLPSTKSNQIPKEYISKSLDSVDIK